MLLISTFFRPARAVMNQLSQYRSIDVTAIITGDSSNTLASIRTSPVNLITVGFQNPNIWTTNQIVPEGYVHLAFRNFKLGGSDNKDRSNLSNISSTDSVQLLCAAVEAVHMSAADLGQSLKTNELLDALIPSTQVFMTA